MTQADPVSLYLIRVVARLSIDALRVRRRLADSYPGFCLPDPIAETAPLWGRMSPLR
ncbi:hypothetical protein [Rhodospirillum sp. A1_3_36]|uniref:hypothetical protein n=1 Tax=Rhodospirillum sp. A1_3_36 TaxID=3391666 RepID=UPI0039A5D680